MNSSGGILGLVARSLALLGTLALPVAVQAQTAAPELQEQLAPADQKALDDARTLTRYEALWSKPVNWNSKAASLSALTASVQTLIGKDGPTIEVRAPEGTRLTFALHPAPLGATLVSLARLENCRVWVFASGIVIAPETTLSDEERLAVKKRAGGEWTLSSVVRHSSESWGGRDQLARVLLGIIGADVQKQLGDKGRTVPIEETQETGDPRDRAPFELPFGELHPASQRLLQEMLDEQIKNFRQPLGENESSVLSPTVIVCFDDTNKAQVTLFLRGAALNPYVTRWYASTSK